MHVEEDKCGGNGLDTNGVLAQDQFKSLVEGYQLTSEQGYPTLSLPLADGGKWTKLVWSRTSAPRCLYRWSTPEEVLSYLISFDHHTEWLSHDVPTRPPSGTIKFYDRSKTKQYRNDGFDWKTRHSASNTVREDRIKLKIVGQQRLVSACYTHSVSNPHLHRRYYWLVQNPQIIMMHYLETDMSSHKKTMILKNLQQNHTQVSMEGTTPSDLALLAISDENLCKFLLKAPDSNQCKSMLTSLSNWVWLAASKYHHSNQSVFFKLLNDKVFSDLIATEKVPPVPPNGTMPLLLINQAMELLKLQAFSSQYGNFSLLPKGPGCLPPGLLLQAASYIINNEQQTPVILRPHTVPVTTHLPLTTTEPTYTTENEILKPPTLDSIKSLLPEPLDSESDICPTSTSRVEDFNMQDFSRFAQSLRNMNPLRDLEKLGSTSNNECQQSQIGEVQKPVSQVQEPAHRDQEPIYNHVSEQLQESDIHVDSESSWISHSDTELSETFLQQFWNEISSATPTTSTSTSFLSLESTNSFLQTPPTFSTSDHMTLNNELHMLNFTQSSMPTNSPQNPSDTPQHTSLLATTTFPQDPLSVVPSSFSQDPSSVSAPSYSQNPPSIGTPPFPQDPSSVGLSTFTQNPPSLSTSFPQDPLSIGPSSFPPEPLSFDINIDAESLKHLLDTVEEAPLSPTSRYMASFIPLDDSLINQEGDYSSLPRTDTNSSCDQGTGPHIDNNDWMESETSYPTNPPINNADTTSSIPFIQSPHTPLTTPDTSSPPPPHGYSETYRYSSPVPSPSTPSLASVSSLSTAGGESYFDQSEPPSVAELCEMISESPVVQSNDFSHLSLTDSDQQELIRASRVIQSTLRQCKDHTRLSSLREKHAVLCIEKSYKRYREAKKMRDDAARRIQYHYRLYRKREQELQRAALFIQQMYRYQRHRNTKKKH